MKIKLTLDRSERPSVDLVATVDAATTVGDLARYLQNADPLRQARPAPPVGLDQVTLGIVGDHHVVLDPRLPIGEGGLQSGATVSLCQGGTGLADPQVDAAAVVTIIEGPDASREIPLARGSNVIGREEGCEIRLSDPLVSRQHARLNITDAIEVVDLGSANGVQVGATSVQRSAIGRNDVVQVGDTRLTVTMNRSSQLRKIEPSSIAFVRPPRLDPYYEGQVMQAPEPPERPQSQRFPVISLLAPALMGALIYLVTHSTASLIFVALSPLMIVGNAIESRIANRSAYKKALEQFRGDVADLIEEARQAATDEVRARARESPSIEDCVAAVRTKNALVWARSPVDRGFADVRLGMGRRPARNTIEMPDNRRAPRALVRELTEAIAPFATIEPVPVVASFGKDGAIGVAGPRSLMLDAARALLLQIASLHSPAELVITGFASTQTARDWDWAKWLPHVSSAQSPLTVGHLASSSTDTAKLASELEDLFAQRDSDAVKSTPAFVVLVEDDAPIEHSRLVELAQAGSGRGIYVVWLAGSVDQLPAACRTFVDVTSESNNGAVGFVNTGERAEPIAIEVLSAREASELARVMSPMVDSGARSDDASDLPRSVSLLSLSGRRLAGDARAVIERWSENRSILSGPYGPPSPPKVAGSLRAVVGQGAGGEPHVLDLRTDGPHALVGGTTGAGKSEMLQSWILSMAAAHSPQRLTFLLVDYKGEAAFRDCKDLPHTVGLVTDLNPHLVRRALRSLSAELQYREAILARYDAKDLETLERQGHLDVPPSLVLVVDEFAALVQEMPEFVEGVVNVAQRGRSLGLHLILATQQPSGVIKGNLRANTNLRLALRMADESDSIDVLGSPQAAFFDRAVPGRAVSKTGPGRLIPFQAGYIGGWTSDEPPPPEILVEELAFGAGRVWELVEADDVEMVDRGPTDIERLVLAISNAGTEAQLPPPRKPWQPELKPIYEISDRKQVPSSRRDAELVFGILDDPRNQSQPSVAFYPDKDGNLAVYGTGGSGKSTVLRTLAVAAGFARGGPCHVYGLDFGARGLSIIEPLPHVGSVISGSDEERVSRLIAFLRTLIDERAVRYTGAGSITAYRRITKSTDEPRLVVLVDGIAAFRQSYESGERGRLFETFVSICSDGRQVGVHIVLSADRPGAVPTPLAATLQRRLVLRMADEGDYGVMGLPTDVLNRSSPPGRGLIDGHEIQVAILGDGKGESGDVSVQAAAAIELAEVMEQAGVTRAPAIERLTENISLGALPVDVDGKPAVGIASATLEPCGFDPRGTFIVTGPSGSGRSTVLATVVASLLRVMPTASYRYFGTPQSSLADGLMWKESFVTPEAVMERATAIGTALRRSGAPRSVLVIEAVGDFAGGPADMALQELVKTAIRLGHLVIFEGEVGSMVGFGLPALMRTSRAGICLQPDQADGHIFKSDFPRYRRADFPVGRGVLVQKGLASIVQFARPDDPGE